MHDFIMQIGYKVISFFTGIDFSKVLDALSITVTGWLGIFVVTIVIILVVQLLSLLSSKIGSES